MTRLFSFFLLLLTVVAATGPARADVLNPDSVFVVPKVPVQATGSSAQDAQNKAREQGRRRAMDLLLRRLTAEEDWTYLPRLAAGGSTFTPDAQPFGYEGKRPVQLDPAALAAMEEGFSVFDEKSSRTTYSALITYRFKPEDVRRILTEASIPFSQSQTRKALVLPVLQTDNDTYLWETNNPWARAWLARPLVNELTPLVLPTGNVEDVNTITADQARVLNQNGLSQLADKYNVTQVIVALGRVSEQDGQYRLRVRLIEGFFDAEGRVAANFVPGNTAALYDDASGFGGTAAARPVAATVGDTLAEGWFRGPVGDFPALAQRAVEAVVAKYGADWKARTLVNYGQTRDLQLTAWFRNIDEWARIRTALEGTPMVEELDVAALTADGANVRIKVVGELSQLILAMKQRNLILWSEDGMTYNIATPDMAAEVQARPRRAGGLPGFDSLPERPVRPEVGVPGTTELLPDLPTDDAGEDDESFDTGLY